MGSNGAGRPIVVGVDDAAASFVAATAAAELAAFRQVPLRVVRAVPDPSTSDRDGLRYRLDATGEALRVAVPAASVSTALRAGSPELVLRDESRSAGILVIGAGDEDTVPGAGLGPVATALVRSAHCPVLVHRHAHPDGPVVAGLDGRPGTATLLAAATAAATRRDTRLLVLHAWSRRPDHDDAEQTAEAVAAAERHVLDSYVTGPAGGPPQVPTDARIVQGDPDTALVAASVGASLVVVGRRPRAGRTTGGTAVTVAGAARAPVLIVPLSDYVPARDESARQDVVLV